METKKILAILLAVMLTVGTLGTTFADDDGDDDRGERNEHRYEREDDRDDRGEKNEYRENEKKEHKYDDDDDNDGDDDMRPVEPGNGTGSGAEDLNELKKKDQERAALKARYKASFKSRLGDRLDNIPKTKLETIIVLIDTKILELETDNTKTAEQKERLVIVYSAIRDLISEKIAEINEGAILDDLLK